MKRRSVLKMTAGAGALSASTLSGCVDSVFGPTCNTDGTVYEWCFSETGFIDAVDDGTVYARIRAGSRDELRDVVALDAGTGTVEWRHKAEGSDTHYVEAIVQDGIYLQRCQGDEADNCHTAIALNLDGTERWRGGVAVRDLFVANGTVYGFRIPGGTLQAFNATSGRRRWEDQTQEHRVGSDVVDVTDDTVFVEAGSKLLALARTDGTRRWEYETGDNSYNAHISDGVAYTVTDDRIVAISDGAELWSAEFERQYRMSGRGVPESTSNRVLVSVDVEGENAQLHSYDRATGERVWTADAGHREVGLGGEDRWLRVVGDVVYIGVDTLRALDANTGTEFWQTTVGDESIDELTVIEEGLPTDHAVFVQAGASALALIGPDGKQLWNKSVDNLKYAYHMDGYVFVLKDGGIYALNPLKES